MIIESELKMIKKEKQLFKVSIIQKRPLLQSTRNEEINELKHCVST